MLSAVSFSSCKNDDVVEVTEIANEEISWNDVEEFNSKIMSFNSNVTPLFKTGKTRAMSSGDSEEFVLTDSEKETIEKEVQELNQEAKEMFLKIGLTEEEIYEIIDEEHSENLALAAMLIMSAVHDNQEATRALTGNVYLDCAIVALGGDIVSLGRGLYKYGLTKAAAKAALRAAATRLSGPIGVALTVAAWGLCVGGIG